MNERDQFLYPGIEMVTECRRPVLTRLTVTGVLAGITCPSNVTVARGGVLERDTCAYAPVGCVGVGVGSGRAALGRSAPPTFCVLPARAVMRVEKSS